MTDGFVDEYVRAARAILGDKQLQPSKPLPRDGTAIVVD
jgi:hypothetical protein